MNAIHSSAGSKFLTRSLFLRNCALAVLLLATVGSLLVHARAAEPWADSRLSITSQLELWFDASRQSAGRETLQLSPLTTGRSVDYLLDASGQRRHLAQPVAENRPRFRQEHGSFFLRFDGTNDSLDTALLRSGFTNATVFIVAAPRSNGGGFRGFFGFSQAGRNDYTTGLNLDFGPFGSPQLSFINTEGAGAGGAVSIWSGQSLPFGGWHTFSLVCANGPQSVRLFADGLPRGARDRQPARMHLDTFALGARHYSNSGEPPFTQGYLHGDIAELLLFSRALSDAERSTVEKYLSTKHAALLALPAAGIVDGSRPLATVSNPPPVQVLLPGFIVQELPVTLNNINNVKYRPDGKLVALGYDGRVHLLSDTDGDGLEDTVEPFWNTNTVRAPIGMALTPPGYTHGQGVIVPGKGKVALIVDTNADDRADMEISVANWTEPSEQHGVDGLGVAVDRENNIYFGLGAASYTGAYLFDKTTGQARYSLRSERGTILKVSPDFTRREIVCTGIRFPVALAFNRNGDLFCTDQEGATWLPNGNPLDELLHIQPGRHYGFPPRHPKHLPNVIDEPSVFDYAPQHQSTCGLNFNEPVNGGPAFGLDSWAGDAFVAGYSRGKLYRTKLEKTSNGYVAQNHLFACLSELTVDACVSPQGDLIVVTHSGQPDWGSGPNGKGKLYRIRYAATNSPQPVLAWSASPSEFRIAFDRPLNPAHLKNLARQTSITRGRYVFAGDQFETIRPGYQVVYDQLSAPRFEVPVLSANLAADHRTVIFAVPPQHAAMNHAITLPDFSAPETRRATDGNAIPQHSTIDLFADLCGLEAHWLDSEGKTNWSGWLPHPDLTVARAFTRSSSGHEVLWKLLQQPGTLRLRGQLDLKGMLQPVVQPGSKLDFTYPPEGVNIAIRSAHDMNLTQPEQKTARGELGFSVTPKPGQWAPFEMSIKTGGLEPSAELTWSTADDSRQRAFPLRRFLLPWAAPKVDAPADAPAERSISEVAGGNWLRGKELFFGESLACAKCHRVRGQGNEVGPDLSNLVHRDYASVLKDIREPNAAINPDHVAYNVDSSDGEALTAVLKNDGRDQLTFADASGRDIAIARNKIASIKPSTLSLMPEGLMAALNPAQLKDLMTFLLTTPLDPAAIEAPNPPPPRTRAELLALPLPENRRAGHHHEPVDGRKAAQAGTAAKEFHIVLCAGPKDHGPGEHDYPLWQKRWSKLLALADRVKVGTATGWPTPEQFKSADVIAFYSNNPGWNAGRAAELDSFLARGGGLAYLHYAVDGHKDVDALAQRIGLAWKGGASKFRHGALDLKLHPHPLADGLGRLDFIDESYWQLLGDARKVDLLATGIEDGQPQPLIWTRTQGKGRVFVSILGHYNWTFDDPLFRLLVLRGICWAGNEPMDRLVELTTIGARISE